MTVKELIETLSKFPMDKVVEIGSPTDEFGKVEQVVEWNHFVEIQSSYDSRDYK